MLVLNTVIISRFGNVNPPMSSANSVTL